jgi:hypothetical protein
MTAVCLDTPDKSNRKLVRRFREAGATDPEHAVALKVIGERHTWVFDRMVRAGVFRSAPDGRYFMDEAAATKYRNRCRVGGLVGVAICLLLFLVFGCLEYLADDRLLKAPSIRPLAARR